MTVQDDLLEARLEKTPARSVRRLRATAERARASARCWWMSSICSTARDCSSISSATSPPSRGRCHRTASPTTYEADVQFRKFAETLTEGCGPGCGTEEAKGQGGCDSCAELRRGERVRARSARRAAGMERIYYGGGLAA